MDIAFINPMGMKPELDAHDSKFFFELVWIGLGQLIDGVNAEFVQAFFCSMANPPEIS